MVQLKLISMGHSTGVVFPEEVLAHLKVSQGDTLFLTESPEGYWIMSSESDIARQMEFGRKVMRERRDVLKKLAE